MTDSSNIRHKALVSNDENENVHYFYGTSSKTPVFSSSSSLSTAGKPSTRVQSFPLRKLDPRSSLEYLSDPIDALKKVNPQSYENLPSSLSPNAVTKPSVLGRQRLVSPLIRHKNAMFEREVSNYTSTTEDLFFEASPVLPITSSLNATIIQNGDDDAAKLEPQQVDIKYFPTLLTESYPQVVEVEIQPHMSEPLPSDIELDLTSIKLEKPFENSAAALFNTFPLRESLPTREQQDELKLIRILSEEIDALRSDPIKRSRKSVIITYFRKLLFYKEISPDSAWIISPPDEEDQDQEQGKFLTCEDSDGDIEEIRSLLYS